MNYDRNGNPVYRSQPDARDLGVRVDPQIAAQRAALQGVIDDLHNAPSKGARVGTTVMPHEGCPDYDYPDHWRATLQRRTTR